MKSSLKRCGSVLLGALLLGAYGASAQMRSVQVEKLPVEKGSWRAERFSPSGQELYLTTQGYDGIWEFDLSTRTIRQITSSPGSGYGFALSPDGKQLAYKTRQRAKGRTIRQDLVITELASGASRVAFSERALSLPAFSRTGAACASTGTSLVSSAPVEKGEVMLLGIENTKIILQRDGKRVVFDPLGGGSYIWPSLSPDRTRMTAYDMSVGTIVADLNGRVTARLGRRDAASWTRDGRWLIYMDDRDDGDRLISSDIYAISADGRLTVQLTATPNVNEMDPHCSPTQDQFVCSSPEGDLYLITYAETDR